ncbi:hypothetical protein OIU74_011151 [Salix koriyanagi]|uniref:Uncharacterized protein n=1 Tax=Salix koriyanagi TaxID=2511006 RepID=A0A9Q0YTV7_9ROSI|nr:hypothetical protein OIU74_011151 [Salix koriyanagi]
MPPFPSAPFPFQPPFHLFSPAMTVPIMTSQSPFIFYFPSAPHRSNSSLRRPTRSPLLSLLIRTEPEATKHTPISHHSNPHREQSRCHLERQREN